MTEHPQNPVLATECPSCGRQAQWIGKHVIDEEDRFLFRMRCGFCEHEFDEMNPEWERRIVPRP